jgi:hypothetical protein
MKLKHKKTAKERNDAWMRQKQARILCEFTMLTDKEICKLMGFDSKILISARKWILAGKPNSYGVKGAENE